MINVNKDWCVEHIREFSGRLADAATVNLGAQITHCDGWTMSDLVTHLADVQWFWADIVTRRVVDIADRRHAPKSTIAVDPTERLREHTAALCDSLSDATTTLNVWTWWPAEQSVAFVLRRQMIEAAMHCFDAEHAVGRAWSIPPDVAVCGLQEFIDVMATDVREGCSPRQLHVIASDVDWEATMFSGGAEPAVSLRGPAAELLRVLWGRGDNVEPDVAACIAAVDLS